MPDLQQANQAHSQENNSPQPSAMIGFDRCQRQHPPQCTPLYWSCSGPWGPLQVAARFADLAPSPTCAAKTRAQGNTKIHVRCWLLSLALLLWAALLPLLGQEAAYCLLISESHYVLSCKSCEIPYQGGVNRTDNTLSEVGPGRREHRHSNDGGGLYVC